MDFLYLKKESAVILQCGETIKLAFGTFIFQVKEVHFEHQKNILFLQGIEVKKEVKVKEQDSETRT